jgi:tetratricopeptide (TPR) repeat protein
LVSLRGDDSPGKRDPECGEKLLAGARSRLPGLGPLVWTRLCEGLWSVPMLVPSLLVSTSTPRPPDQAASSFPDLTFPVFSDQPRPEGVRLGNDRTISDYYSERGFAYLKKDDYIRAMLDLDNAIRLNPRALKNRGLVYQAKGDTARGDADLEAAKELGE